MKNRNIAITVLLIVWFAQCMDSEDPEVPYFLGAYTPADLGIIQTEAEKQALIPVISEQEREVLSEVVSYMEEQGMADEKVFKEASRENRMIIQGIPLTESEINEKLDAERYGGTWNGQQYRSLSEVIARESEAADEFYSDLQDQFPVFSDQELMNLRINNTVALLILRVQQDYGKIENGLSDEVLELYRQKAVEFRKAINVELMRRDVKL